MQIKKQQLELDIEQQTGSKLGKEYIKAVYYQFVSNFPGGSEITASASNVGDLGLIPGLGRSPGEGNGNPF